LAFQVETNIVLFSITTNSAELRSQVNRLRRHFGHPCGIASS